MKYENMDISKLTPKQRYYVKNREKILVQKQLEYVNNREETIARRKTRYRSNEKVRKAAWATNLKHKYGITVEEYDQMLKIQNGRCAICDVSSHETKTGKSHLAVDHDHKTGRVRALLCSHCNAGLGAFRDDTVVLNKAVEYLNEHRR